MGFELRGSTARLEFLPGTLLAGAIVKVSLDTALRDVLALLTVLDRMQVGAAEVAAAEEAFRAFGDSILIGWDLELDGEPIPANGEGMASVPLAVALAVLEAWSRAIGTVPGNSLTASANGTGAVERSRGKSNKRS